MLSEGWFCFYDRVHLKFTFSTFKLPICLSIFQLALELSSYHRNYYPPSTNPRVNMTIEGHFLMLFRLNVVEGGWHTACCVLCSFHATKVHNPHLTLISRHSQQSADSMLRVWECHTLDYKFISIITGLWLEDRQSHPISPFRWGWLFTPSSLSLPLVHGLADRPINMSHATILSSRFNQNVKKRV